MTPNSSKRT